MISYYKAIGLAGLAALLLVPLPASNLWWREVANSSHTLLFLFVSIYIYSLIHSKYRFSSDVVAYLLALVIAMLLGVMVEVVQVFGSRDASLNDILRNFIGVMAGLSLVAVFKLKQVQGKVLVLAFALILSAAFLWLGLSPLLHLSWHYIERHNAFPVIVDFDESWSSSFVRYNHGKMAGTLVSGSQSYHLIQFDPGVYPGVSVIEPEPDWSDYGDLQITIYSASKSAHYMVLRVHDNKHNQQHQDRFNKSLLVKPGLNVFIVPLSQVRHGAVERELDLRNIAGLELFSPELKEPVRIAVVDMVLKQQR